jgi:hypothetical protein
VSPTFHERWHEANKRYLAAAVRVVRCLVEQHVARARGEDSGAADRAMEEAKTLVAEASSELSRPSALDVLCGAFALSSFERGVLLLCAGMELQSDFADAFAAAGPGNRLYPTFGLSMAVLPEPHWSAFVSASPLRRYNLIDVGQGSTLTTSPLRVNEWVLHFLLGVTCFDERLQSLLLPVRSSTHLPPSHSALADQVEQICRRNVLDGSCTAVQLSGASPSSARAIAAFVCEKLSLHLCAARAADLVGSPADLDLLSRLWDRAAVLTGGALLIECDESTSPEALRAAAAIIDRVSGLVFVVSREPLRLRAPQAISFEVKPLTAGEQRALWRQALEPFGAVSPEQTEALVVQFSMDMHGISSAGTEVRERTQGNGSHDLGDLVWNICRTRARPRLDDLALRIETSGGWDDLVLPELQIETLRQVVANVRQRARVYEAWGFQGRGSRGLGVSAMFAGPSGTGKTMAAEVIAGALKLDLYRIDLSQVVSKYIGETEKNLRRIFDAAEEGGALLLFDEADALFGKRSDVKDSHDRYANIEVSYLLQRIESYRGLAILTTNMKGAIDHAFLRRIQFAVHFPFPDARQRAEIWHRVFPAATPRDGLDITRLARLNMSGGNIRSIALNAAFLAADAGDPVRMAHILRAARAEYAKLEKPFPETEVIGWT